MLYSEKYDLATIRKENFDFVEFVSPYLSVSDQLIDLGCGTCRKVVRFAPLVKRVTAVDHNEIMLQSAEKRIAYSNILNIDLFLGDNLHAAFNSHIYDVCTTALSVWSAAEVHRLLKGGGVVFYRNTLSGRQIRNKRSFRKRRHRIQRIFV